jgi:hypothetical protein
LALSAVPLVIAPLRCKRPTQAWSLATGAVKNGTATLSYCDEFARIPIWAQEAISAIFGMKLRSSILLRHFTHRAAGHAHSSCRLPLVRGERLT